MLCLSSMMLFMVGSLVGEINIPRGAKGLHTYQNVTVVLSTSSQLSALYW